MNIRSQHRISNVWMCRWTHVVVAKVLYKRAFSVAAPTIWYQIKSSETKDTYRKTFESYLFEIAFLP